MKILSIAAATFLVVVVFLGLDCLWTSLFAAADWFAEEIEVYELADEGWRATTSFRPEGVRYGERGPAASAVLCAELSPGRVRHLLSPGGLRKITRRRAVRAYRGLRPRDADL